MNNSPLHKNLSDGGWYEMSLAEQLGNIGSEVSRASISEGKNNERFNGAVERALELFNLTLSDMRWRGRLKEIARARDVFVDTVYNEGEEYKSNLKDLDKYFFHFALLARK